MHAVVYGLWSEFCTNAIDGIGGMTMNERLKRVVFGALDPKTGAAGSVVNLFDQPQLNYQTALQGGVLADESSAMLKLFFSQRREEKLAQALLRSV